MSSIALFPQKGPCSHAHCHLAEDTGARGDDGQLPHGAVAMGPGSWLDAAEGAQLLHTPLLTSHPSWSCFESGAKSNIPPPYSHLRRRDRGRAFPVTAAPRGDYIPTNYSRNAPPRQPHTQLLFGSEDPHRPQMGLSDHYLQTRGRRAGPWGRPSCQQAWSHLLCGRF